MLNVRDSDATLIISRGPLAGGSLLTRGAATRLGRPVLHLDLTNKSDADAAAEVRAWLRAVRPNILNVAGPRASEDAAIGGRAAALLGDALRETEA